MIYWVLKSSENKTIPVNKQWINLILYLQNEVKDGTIELEMRNGTPYKAHKTIKSTLF